MGFGVRQWEGQQRVNASRERDKRGGRLLPVGHLVKAFLICVAVLAGCTRVVYVEREPEEKVSVASHRPAVEGTQKALPPRLWDAAPFVKSLPPNPRHGPDGLEGLRRTWSSIGWANPVQVSVWPYPDSEEDKVIVVKLLGGSHEKAMVSGKVRRAFASAGTFRVDVYNPAETAIPVAFAIRAGPDGIYSESSTQPAPRGWTHLEYDLAAATYKTPTSDWEHTSKLRLASDVREIFIHFYHSGEGALALDRMEVDIERTPKTTEDDGFPSAE